MDERDKDRVFFAIMALASVVASTLGVALALTLRRSSVGGLGGREPLSLSVDIPEVHYADGQVLVSVRSPGEWHELREFVQPSNPEVISTIRRVFYG